MVGAVTYFRREPDGWSNRWEGLRGLAVDRPWCLALWLEAALRLVGIEGQAVEVFLGLGAARLCVPLGESAGEILRDGTGRWPALAGD